MEHVRSTLATTAAAVFGLVMAAHVLHPGNFEDLPRPTRPVAAQVVAGTTPASAAPPTTAWVDLPFDLYLHPSATTPEMAVLAPRMIAPLPAGAVMAPPLPAQMVAAADRSKAPAVRRRKTAQRPVRTGRAAITRDQRAAPAAVAVRPERRDLLNVSSRDPGVAGDGEG